MHNYLGLILCFVTGCVCTSLASNHGEVTSYAPAVAFFVMSGIFSFRIIRRLIA